MPRGNEGDDGVKAFDVVIVGAGPAGMAAAVAACKNGARVAVIDDNRRAGGQIWRGGEGPAATFAQFDISGAECFWGERVIDACAERKQLRTDSGKLAYSKLILATGARELFLPFPGWTLPGICGVGGLQALAKAGLDVSGQRIVVAGSGPLLMAVAAYLKEHGAQVPLIAEQAPWSSLRRFGFALLRHPAKIAQAVRIKNSILGTRYLAGCWVTEASGDGKVQRVTLTQNGKQIQERCDYLAVSYGFVSNSELAELLGCRVQNGLVVVNEQQETTVKDIFCAGEPTGLGGVDEALIEGETAGYAAAGRGFVVKRGKTAHFSRALNAAFALRNEVKQLAAEDTIVCRCEDVTLGELRRARSWREAKLHYRCGMGPCQGRVCGAAVNELLGWKAESVRPPIFPARIESLIETEETIQR